jgi:hypothetical protein
VTCSSTNDNNLCKMNNKCLNNECTQGIVGRFTPAEDYDNDEVMTITIVSVPPSTIILSFISFMTEPDYDVLEVFECPNATCLDASPPNVLSGKSSIPVPQISETGVMQLKWSSEVCCPKPSSACPCDDPSNANLLTGWLASFYVSGSTHCGPENPLSVSSRLEYNEFRQDGLPPIAGKAVETRTVVSRRQQTHAIHSVPRASQVMLDKYQRHQSIKEPGHALIPSKACQEGSVKRAPGPQRQNLFGSECHLFSRTSQTERKSQARRKTSRLGMQLGSKPLKFVSTIKNAVAQRRLSSSSRYFICDSSNIAAYGSCIASTYEHLQIYNLPTVSKPSFPGLSFQIELRKADFYGQTIITDSSSLLQVFVVKHKANISASILGATVVQMQEGRALFTISLKPIFLHISYKTGSTQLNFQPSIYVTGIDSEALLNENMRSQNSDVHLSNGSIVCPAGYVLNLDTASNSMDGRAGTCVLCKTGTYSVSALKGLLTDDDPACLICPLGGDCSAGGNIVTFAVGQWIISDGIYKLVSCPIGYQLQNAVSGASFSQDVQSCLKCTIDEYIMDSNNSKYKCTKCPVGAICDGKSFKSRLSDALWKAENVSGIFILKSCPKVNFCPLTREA